MMIFNLCGIYLYYSVKQQVPKYRLLVAQ